MKDLHLRPAEAPDLPAITAIYNAAVVATTASYDLVPVSLESRQAWFESHAREGHPILVAVDAGGTVLGWGSLSAFRVKPGYRHTVENSLYVAEEARGRGIGGALLDALIAAARELGHHAVIAGVDATNDGSIRLHAARGFEVVGTFREVGRKFDRWLDVVFLELLLSP